MGSRDRLIRETLANATAAHGATSTVALEAGHCLAVMLLERAELSKLEQVTRGGVPGGPMQGGPELDKALEETLAYAAGDLAEAEGLVKDLLERCGRADDGKHASIVADGLRKTLAQIRGARDGIYVETGVFPRKKVDSDDSDVE